MTWMIYGANGYTGELIAREARARGLSPILAGRDSPAIRKLAAELGLEPRIFSLANHQKLVAGLLGVKAVVHAAGPFARTAAAMVQGCLDSGTNYLDITGEIPVFESIMRVDRDAREAGVALIPGVGFDVVPTDCLAAMLAAKVPNATELTLAFCSEGGGISPGTMKTIIEGAGKGGAIRRDGVIIRVPLAWDAREIPFPGRSRMAMTIPWGDVSTAFYTTGIPNIRVYSATSPKTIARMRAFRPLLRLLRFAPLRRGLQSLAGRRQGPDQAVRSKARIHLWGEARDAAGHSVTMTMTVPEGYDFTARSSVMAIEKVLNGRVGPGSWTPARAFGADFVRLIEGVEVHES